MEDKKEKLESEKESISEDEVEVSLLADLQEQQDAEAASYITDITVKVITKMY